MAEVIDLLRKGRKEELWQMCCGFLDSDMEEVMAIQNRLMLEQIELLKNCELGRKLMHGAMPMSVQEFREQVPLTTYNDYLPDLVEKREDVLPSKVAHWIRTSGRTGEYAVKWVPISEDFAREYEKLAGAVALLATCNGRGDTSNIREHLKMLFTVGSPEYASGILCQLVQQAVGIELLPSNGADMSFEQRIKSGFAEAMYKGIDAFGGLPSVLVAVGEQLKSGSGKVNVRPLLSHPKALFRVLRALLRCKLAHRTMTPKDLWSIKGIVCGGADGAILKNKIKELWGRSPLEAYINTEGGLCAIQAWDYDTMTFVPSLNFFEFIPEKEWFKSQIDSSYKPKTVLLDELKPGEVYEVVFSSLHGGAMVRYRIGDMVRIVSLRNEKCGIDSPQMVFERRADDLIDINGFGHITEKLLWQAIENSGVPYVDWTARKEIGDEKSTLHIYIELKSNFLINEQALSDAVYEEFQKLDAVHNFNLYKFAYGDAMKQLNSKPVVITTLPEGAFANFISHRRSQGADLGRLKPPHINPTEEVLSLLGAARVKVEAVPTRETERITVR